MSTSGNRISSDTIWPMVKTTLFMNAWKVITDLLLKWSKKNRFYTSFQVMGGFLLLLGQTKPHNAAT
jgi:hypothetical protein